METPGGACFGSGTGGAQDEGKNHSEGLACRGTYQRDDNCRSIFEETNRLCPPGFRGNSRVEAQARVGPASNVRGRWHFAPACVVFVGEADFVDSVNAAADATAGCRNKPPTMAAAEQLAAPAGHSRCWRKNDRASARGKWLEPKWLSTSNKMATDIQSMQKTIT